MFEEYQKRVEEIERLTNEVRRLKSENVKRTVEEQAEKNAQVVEALRKELKNAKRIIETQRERCQQADFYRLNYTMEKEEEEYLKDLVGRLMRMLESRHSSSLIENYMCLPCKTEIKVSLQKQIRLSLSYRFGRPHKYVTCEKQSD